MDAKVLHPGAMAGNAERECVAGIAQSFQENDMRVVFLCVIPFWMHRFRRWLQGLSMCIFD